MPDPYSILSCFYYSNIFLSPQAKKKLPPWGKLSPQVIDEGQARHSCPFAVGSQEGRPSSALGHLPLRGKAYLFLLVLLAALPEVFFSVCVRVGLAAAFLGAAFGVGAGVSLFSRRSGTGSSFQSWFSPKNILPDLAWVPFSTRIPTSQ